VKPIKKISQHFFLFIAVGALIQIALIFSNPATAHGAKATRISDVPSALAEPLKSRLLSRRKELTRRLGALNKKFKTFDESNCTAGVEDGSVEDLRCKAEYNRLKGKLAEYDSDVKIFNQSIALGEGMAVLLGDAFNIGLKVRAYVRTSVHSLADASRVFIGLWYAEQGSYGKARRLAGLDEASDQTLAEMKGILLSLERKKNKLLKKAITRAVISGSFDGPLLTQYPGRFSQTLVSAHMNIKSGNYDLALRQIAAAKEMNIESEALADAEVYVRQMRASAKEKHVPADPAAIKHRQNMGAAYAGWSLGMLLMDAHMDLPAVMLLSKSAKTMAREGNIEDSAIIFRLANKIAESSVDDRKGFSLSRIYDTASETDIFLDSLEYGRGDWARGLSFLNIAHKASPHNERINEAIAKTEAFMARSK